MKKILVLLLSGIMIAGMTACGDSSPETSPSGSAASSGEGAEIDTSDATYTIRLGTPTGEAHFQNYTAELFKESVEEATDGDIAVQICPDSQLGTPVQMIQGVQDSSIEAIMIPSSYFASFAPASAVLDIPFLFNDNEQIFEIMNEENSLNEYMENYGFKVAAWMKNSPRYILGHKKYESLSDMKDQKIWCPPCEILQDEMEIYGASAQTLDLSDIAAALENGTVDAVSTDIIFMVNQGFSGSAEYLNEIPGTPMINLFCFSSGWFETLPENYQTLLLDTAQEIVMESESVYVDELYESCIQSLQENGVEIVEPSDTFIEELWDAGAYLADEFCAESDENAAIFDELTVRIEEYTGE